MVFKDISAVSEARFGGELRIFPNPADGVFQVELPEGGQVLRIWDAQGQLVLQRDIPHDAPNQISTNGWAAGHYIVQIVGKNSSWTGQVVVNH